MECLLPCVHMYGDCTYHIMIGLKRILDYRGGRLERFHYILYSMYMYVRMYMCVRTYIRTLYHVCAVCSVNIGHIRCHCDPAFVCWRE